MEPATILLPTDFSEGAAVAFAHGLKIALSSKAELDIFHVEPDNDQTDWHWAPSVIQTLRRWGVVPADADEAAVHALGVRARRTSVAGAAADEAILAEMAQVKAGLIVMATHGRAGLQRWTQPSVTASVATKAAAPVLLMPASGAGFVDLATGAHTLRKVLVAVDTEPRPARAVEAARAFIAHFGDEIELATVHVGEPMAGAQALLEGVTGAAHIAIRDGDVVEGLLGAATAWGADLIVTVTQGRRGLLDAMRGSTVERLIARTTLPLLVVTDLPAT